MFSHASPAHGWMKALIGGLLLALFPSLLTGCRFGNKSKVEVSGYDTVSGYYASEPQSFDSEVKFTDGSVRPQSHPVSRIAGYFRNTITNPLVLILQDVQSGSAVLANPADTRYNIGVTVNSNQNTFESPITGSITHYGCRLEYAQVDRGSFTKNDPATVNGINVRGRLEIERQFTVDYTGTASDCQELREIFHTCLTDAPNCPSDNEDEIAQIFYSDAIASGVLSAAEVKTVQTLRTVVQYQ